jgi:hypothetical protein
MITSPTKIDKSFAVLFFAMAALGLLAAVFGVVAENYARAVSNSGFAIMSLGLGLWTIRKEKSESGPSDRPSS